MPETNYHLFNENPLYQKFAYEAKVKFVSAYLFYNNKGVAQKLIHTMKYKNMPQIGRFLGSEYGRKLVRAGLTADIIIPVPIHGKKESLRGFNQSQIIAEGLAEHMEIPIDSKSVIRKADTSTQTRKSRVERWLNVEDIYIVKRPENIAGKSVMVVDDVLTTGATIGMLVDQLVKEGADSISIVAIAAGK